MIFFLNFPNLFVMQQKIKNEEEEEENIKSFAPYLNMRAKKFKKNIFFSSVYH